MARYVHQEIAEKLEAGLAPIREEIRTLREFAKEAQKAILEMREEVKELRAEKPAPKQRAKPQAAAPRPAAL